MKNDLLSDLRAGRPLSLREQLILIVRLSFPAILAQLSSILMQYIDASMVGSLGANASASIGLMSSSTWLLGGTCFAAVTGFTVQVAQKIGAGDMKTARDITKQGFVVALTVSALLALLGASLSGVLPGILGGGEEIRRDATLYFMIYALSLSFVQLNNVSGGMLQVSGNMKVPSILHILMCGLDVVFNQFLIFPSSTVLGITLPGAGLGVAGAALGTALAQTVTAVVMVWFLFARSPMLKLRRGEGLKFSAAHLKRGAKISLPIAFERIVMCGAQIIATTIVAPLGTVAIAANSFSVTAESFCYMPGEGIASAATTLVGQSIGAKRRDLTRRLGWLSTLVGIGVMTVTGILLYIGAPFILGLLSPDLEIVSLGVSVLRIEAFAEPFFAAAIVGASVFRATGDTVIPSCLNFISMWAVRLPLAAYLAPKMGLRGVWTAMCVEICVRGLLFLIRLKGRRWSDKVYEKVA